MTDLQERIRKLSPKRLALLALELQLRVDELERQKSEPIAIVGIGCRVPQYENGPKGFWQLLVDGADTLSQVPAERWDRAAFYDADPDTPGRMSTTWGSFLREVDRFDASLFEISRREAVNMDPQQRILLEVCWEALEHAGYSPKGLSGTSTGVFAGISTNDYYGLLLNRGTDAIDAYVATGTAHSIATGRISYTLGLRGPNLAVDTACSASLVAVHLACQSLHMRECAMALAGGVNAILSPEVTIALSKSHMMAADGRCKAFDSRADGFVRGEGCGIVVLKRLSDAVADGDRVLALVRGSAVNQDGRSSGITAPNGAAQEAVIRQALANAGVQPEEIGYVEAHGTGTALGDPIEAHALAAVFGPGRSADSPLVLGSVKTNLGHLEAAAGVAGLIKVVLALQKEHIPAHLHFHRMNPHIDWNGAPVEIPVNGKPWPRGEKRRVAGVSSFGFSGTNAHVIVEEAPLMERPRREIERRLHLLALSGRSAEALGALKSRYAEALEETCGELGDICYTANAGRAHFQWRAAYIGATKEEMREALLGPGCEQGTQEGAAEVVFLFSGQGAQYAGMGKELYDSQPVFRQAIEECGEILEEEVREPLQEVLWGRSTAFLDQTLYTQPALFAVEYALAELWKSWGIEPGAVLGHSVGEYVAACVAGVYSLAEGLHLIAARGRLMQAVAGEGAMSAVLASEERIREALRGMEERVTIAAMNGPESAVISGYTKEVGTVEERLRAMGVRVQRLRVSHGFHSPQMREMEGAFAAVAGGVRCGAPRVRLISSVTGQAVGREEMSEAQYWVRQVREPVRFRDAMETLGGQGARIYVEIGPGTTLVGLGRQCVGGEGGRWVASLKKGRGEWEQILESLGRLYVEGAEVNWAGFDAPYGRRRVELPTYPFERKRYWIEGSVPSRPSACANNPPQDAAEVPADWWYTLAWEPRPIRESADSSHDLPAPDALAHSLSPRASELRTECRFDRYDSLRPQLNVLCAAFAAEGLRRAGWEFRPGDRFSSSALYDRLGILETHRMLFRRLLEILAEDRTLQRDGEDWRVLRIPPKSNPSAECHALKGQYPDFRNEIALLARCGASLDAVLRGVADPLQLLFPGGSFEEAAELYANSPGSRVFNQLASDAVASEVNSRQGGRIRVLEIGAGTGGTTAYIASALPSERSEYTYTDVSPLLVASANEKFRSYPFFRYRTLDIEREPTAQGFQPEAFDIVVVANALHATQGLRETLRHVRTLLAPSGLLLVIEGTAPERWVDLTFGMTEGWWRFRDYNLRSSYPLISRSAWLTLLREEGFLSPGAVQPAEGSQQALLLARAPKSQTAVSANWLVLPDIQGFAAALGRKLAAIGANVTFVEGNQTAQQYLQAGRFDQVLDFSALDIPSIQELSPETLGVSDSTVTSNFLAMAQAVATFGGTARFWMVTRGAQAVIAGQSPLNVTQAPLWGLGKTMALEHPEVWGGALDLDPVSGPEDSAASILPAILLSDGEDQSAFRNGARYVARLIRREPPVGPLAQFHPEAAYLITGGLGGLGLRVAKWMVERGARRLVLTSRKGLPDRSVWEQVSENEPAGRQIAAVRMMENLGADVRVSVTDVGDPKAMQALFDSFADGELKGVIHAAATPDSCLIRDLHSQRLASVMRAKTDGTLILHRLTESMKLDFFVLFSSWASLLGARELAHYVAANQFLDGIAHYRRGLGLPALAINWAAWDEIRAASDTVLQDYTRGGMKFMSSDLALTSLGRALSCADAQIAVAAVNWDVLKPLYESRRSRPLLEYVFNVPSHSPKRDEESDIIHRLISAIPEHRMDLLISSVCSEVAAVLRMETGHVDIDQGLFELGMDSLMSVELKGRLESRFKKSLPSTLTFSHPTVRALARYLEQLLRQDFDGQGNASSSPFDDGDDSEDQLAARLSAVLQGIEDHG